MVFDLLTAHGSHRASVGLIIFLAAVGLKLVLARVMPNLDRTPSCEP